MAIDKAKSTLKEMLISMLAIVISIVLAVFALGVANWALDVFNITGDLAQVAALIVVAIVIGPTMLHLQVKNTFSSLIRCLSFLR